MDMLQSVIRPSIDRAVTASPLYSTACPTPPFAPNTAMTCKAKSLAVTPRPSRPSIWTRIVFALVWRRHWVARTHSISLAPIPKASAPKAPCVEV